MFDPQAQKTRHMRYKATTTDYRYMPDPNLPPVHIQPQFVEQVRATLPVLPDQRREELLRVGVRPDEVRRLIEHDAELFFDECMKAPLVLELIRDRT